MDEEVQNSTLNNSHSSETAASIPKRKRGRPKNSSSGTSKRKKTLIAVEEMDIGQHSSFKVDNIKSMLKNLGGTLLEWIIEGVQIVGEEAFADMVAKIQRIESVLQEKKGRAEKSKSSRQQKAVVAINPLLDSAAYLINLTENYLQQHTTKNHEDSHDLSFDDLFDEDIDKSPEKVSMSHQTATTTKSILKTAHKDSISLRKKISFAKKATHVYQDNETSQIILAISTSSCEGTTSNIDTRSKGGMALNDPFPSYKQPKEQLKQNNASINQSEDNMFCDDSESIIDSSFQNNSLSLENKFSEKKNVNQFNLENFHHEHNDNSTCHDKQNQENSIHTEEISQVSSEGNYSTFDFANQIQLNSCETLANVFSDELLNALLSQYSVVNNTTVDNRFQETKLPFHNFTLALPNSSPCSEEILDTSVNMAINLVKGSEPATDVPQVHQSTEWTWKTDESTDIVPNSEIFMGGGIQLMEHPSHLGVNNYQTSQTSSLNMSLLFDETDNQEYGPEFDGEQAPNFTQTNHTDGHEQTSINCSPESRENKIQNLNTQPRLESKIQLQLNTEYQKIYEKPQLLGPTKQDATNISNSKIQIRAQYATPNASKIPEQNKIGPSIFHILSTMISEPKRQDSSERSRNIRDDSKPAINASSESRSNISGLEGSFVPTHHQNSKLTENRGTTGVNINEYDKSIVKIGPQPATLEPNEADDAQRGRNQTDSSMPVFDVPTVLSNTDPNYSFILGVKCKNTLKEDDKSHELRPTIKNNPEESANIDRETSAPISTSKSHSKIFSNHSNNNVLQDTKTRYECTLLAGNWLKTCLQQSTNSRSTTKLTNSELKHENLSNDQYNRRNDDRSNLNPLPCENKESKSAHIEPVIKAKLNFFSEKKTNATTLRIEEPDLEKSLTMYNAQASLGKFGFLRTGLLSRQTSFPGQIDRFQEAVSVEENGEQRNSSIQKFFPSCTPLDDTVQVQIERAKSGIGSGKDQPMNSNFSTSSVNNPTAQQNTKSFHSKPTPIKSNLTPDSADDSTKIPLFDEIQRNVGTLTNVDELSIRGRATHEPKHVFLQPAEVTKRSKKLQTSQMKKHTINNAGQGVFEKLKQTIKSVNEIVRNKNASCPPALGKSVAANSINSQRQRKSSDCLPDKFATDRITEQSHEVLPNLLQFKSVQEESSLKNCNYSPKNCPQSVSTKVGNFIDGKSTPSIQDQYFGTIDKEKRRDNYEGSEMLFEDCDKLSWALEGFSNSAILDSHAITNPNIRRATPSERKNIQTAADQETSHPQKANTQINEDQFIEYESQTQLSWGLSASCEIPSYQPSRAESAPDKATCGPKESVFKNFKPPLIEKATNGNYFEFKYPTVPTQSAETNGALSFAEFMRDIRVSSTERCEEPPTPESGESNRKTRTEKEEIDDILNGIKYVRMPPESELIPATDINELINDQTFVW